jgi:protein involved in polysaccharide export with SLBB domain
LGPTYHVTRSDLTPAAHHGRARLRHTIRTMLVHFVFALTATLAAGAALGAQQPGDTGRTYPLDALSTGQFASRASLEQLARGTGPAAQTAQERLTDGDFQVGDRIALMVSGEPTLTDTFTVREGQILRLPNIPDIPLHGVLHAELQDTLAHDLASYIKNPDVHATPLVRLAVLGQVARPGYYSAGADELVSSLFMQAGGLEHDSDLGKTVVRRGTQTLYSAKEFQAAMTQGETIDQLAIRPGDEVVVGQHPPGGAALRYLGIAAILAGIGASIAFIATR